MLIIFQFDGGAFLPTWEFSSLAPRPYNFIVRDSTNCEVGGTLNISAANRK